jgi:hypothetical protein
MEESQPPDLPAPLPPPELPEPPTSDDSEPSYSHTRTGKVARLPKEIRDQVNQMLLDNVPFSKIIEAIGDHGKGISENNMGNWKKGGFKEWVEDQDRNQALVLRRDSALSILDKKAGATVQDASRTIAAAQLYELLLTFDPTAFAHSLADKPELYLRLIGALARLSEGEAACASQRAKESAAQPDTQPGNVVTPEALKQILRQIKLL